MDERPENFRDELQHAGYSQEEAYFNRINAELIERQRKGKGPGTSDSGTQFAQAKGALTPVRWDEKPYEILSRESRLSMAAVEYNFHGEAEGRGRGQYLLYYRHFNEKDVHHSESTYSGFVHWSGTLNGRTGTFILEETGNFEEGVASSTLRIVPGSGTDELKGIIGSGKVLANEGEAHFEIDYVLPDH